MNRTRRSFQRGMLAALLGGIVTACGAPAVVSGPPAGATTRPAATVTTIATMSIPTTAAEAPSPTAIVIVDAQPPEPTVTPPPPPPPPPAQPTVAPTRPAQPTVVPTQAAQPILGFSPQQGAPGTVVSVWGKGYAAGARVAVRLGLPRPTGEVLASAIAGPDGRWSVQLTMPDRLPSGDLIPSGQLNFVAMDAGNVPLASAPFTFTAATAGDVPTPVIRDAQPEIALEPADAVRLFLTSVQADQTGRHAAFYTGGRLQELLLSGETSIETALGVESLHQSFTVDRIAGSDADNTYVEGTLIYGDGTTAPRVFTVSNRETGAWRVFKVTPPVTQP